MSPPASIGVVLLQLGTPDDPTPSALRRYLREFLLDRRVVDLPRARWWPILHGFVLTTRPAKSARLYQRIWTADGSPLLHISRQQADGIEARLRQRGVSVRVAVGMRYGRPSILQAVDDLLGSGCDRILAVPMYPQYSSATTGSSLESLFGHLAGRRVVPALRVVPPYFDEPAYIAALAASVREALDDEQPGHLVVSFHGLPKRYVTSGDPYRDHCEATATALRHALGWPAERMTMAFQSRFGREEWLQPYTVEVLGRLARAGTPVTVVCPGFTADCLETLEEIAITGREQFTQAGGRDYRTVACLNTRPGWLDALSALAARELRGWVDESPLPPQSPAPPSAA